jgi:hypothetical protein
LARAARDSAAVAKRPWDACGSVCVRAEELGGVNSDDVTVRPLVVDDLDWVVHLAAQRAEQRENFAPQFWRRASDARSAHARHLHALMEQGVAAAFRTDHVFAFSVPGPEFVLVDDAAAECDESWATQGPALFRGAAGVRTGWPSVAGDRVSRSSSVGRGGARSGALRGSCQRRRSLNRRRDSGGSVTCPRLPTNLRLLRGRSDASHLKGKAIRLIHVLTGKPLRTYSNVRSPPW